MKKVFIFCFSIAYISSYAFNNFGLNELKAENHQEFYKILGKSLDKVSDIKDINNLYPIINELNRLSNMYQDEWLSDYYVAYLDLKLSMRSEKVLQKKLLKEAKSKIDKIRQNKSAELSEVLTLEGYYYYALIAQDPKVNGQKYYKDVLVAYNKAAAINDKNPRPVLLLCLFKKRMASFMGESQDSFCQDLENIEQMFLSFTPKDELHPKWGLKELNAAKQKTCTKSCSN